MILLTLLIFSLNSYADISYKGQVSFEARVFKNDNNSFTKDYGTSLVPKFEIIHETDIWLTKAGGMARQDFSDSKRNIFIPEDLYTGFNGDEWIIYVGYQILNWSSTEAFHPADVINSRNFDSNLENAEKIGELMLQTTYLLDSGSINLYILPKIQEPNLPESNNRLSFFNPGTSVANPIHIDKDGRQMSDKWVFQWAARIEQSFDSIDLAIYAIQQQDRTNPLINPLVSPVQLYTLPKFQYGITYQQPVGSFLLKVETATIDYDNYGPFIALGQEARDHTQIAFGLDYGLTHKSGSDSTFIFEAMTIPDVSKTNRSLLNTFQRDVLFGYRYALNDVLAKELFISLIADIERGHEYLYSATYSQRLNDVWGIKTAIRFIDAPQKDLIKKGLEPLNKDHQLSFSTTRYF